MPFTLSHSHCLAPNHTEAIFFSFSFFKYIPQEHISLCVHNIITNWLQYSISASICRMFIICQSLVKPWWWNSLSLKTLYSRKGARHASKIKHSMITRTTGQQVRAVASMERWAMISSFFVHRGSMHKGFLVVCPSWGLSVEWATHPIPSALFLWILQTNWSLKIHWNMY